MCETHWCINDDKDVVKLGCQNILCFSIDDELMVVLTHTEEGTLKE